MTVLIADVYDRYKLYAACFALLQVPCCVFLFFIIGPLYKCAKDRTALFILLSKTCFNIVDLITNCVYQNIWAFNNRDVGFFTYVYPPLSQCLAMVISIHVLALAVNRFVAVFFAFKYMRIFKKKNTFIYILFVWIIGIILGIMPRSPTYFYGIFFNMNAYINNVTLFGCSFAYCTMLLKFLQEKLRQNLMSNLELEKNRIMLSFVCFMSLFPSYFFLIIQWIMRIAQPEAGSLLNLALSIGLLCSSVIAQLIEELCLIVFCADLRVFLRKQFRCRSAENAVTTVAISTISVRSTMSTNKNNNNQTQRTVIVSNGNGNGRNLQNHGQRQHIQTIAV